MISVIVLNQNGLKHLEICLFALTRQTYNPQEIIVVDNGSSDGSCAYVENTFPEIKLIRLPENLGFCGGNNVGIKQARGEFIALLNNDTEADSAWLAESVKALEKLPAAGSTASRMRLFDHREHLDTAGDLYFRTGYPGKRGWLMPDGPDYDQPTLVFGACAGAAVYRRAMLDEIGLLDEDFFAYMEDTDLSFRAQLAGYRCVYVPSAIVYHKVGATAGQDSPSRQYWSHRNHWYTLIKNLPAAFWPAYLPQILAAEVLVMGSAIQRRRLGVFARARAEVIRKLPHMLHKRRAIQKLRTVPLEYIDGLIRKDWFAFRKMTKKRRLE